MDDPDTKVAAVPKPTLSDDERSRLDDPLRLVKGLEVAQIQLQQAVDMTLEHSLLYKAESFAPTTYVLSLPAAARLSRQLQEAVDKCLYGSEIEDLA